MDYHDESSLDQVKRNYNGRILKTPALRHLNLKVLDASAHNLKQLRQGRRELRPEVQTFITHATAMGSFNELGVDFAC